MCGITGFINFKNRKISRPNLTKMTGSLNHRGPDGQNIFHTEFIFKKKYK